MPLLIVIFGLATASAQSNKIVFGPLEGDEAGVLTVHNSEAIGIEMWVRTDPDNPTPIIATAHGLMSENVIIVERNRMDPEPEYNSLPWAQFFIDGPYVYDPQYDFPIPEGWTCEMQGALCCDLPGDPGPRLDTQGEWDLYGTWLMVTNTEIATEQTYFPFVEGWYPHSGFGTSWVFEWGDDWVEPDKSYCGLYFESNICVYLPGDCDHNGFPIELTDVLAMIGFYRGGIEPDYLCECSEDPTVYNFAATADPNGNCAPNELLDVVTEIAAYRGTMTASGCPDCPGSEGIVNRENEGR